MQTIDTRALELVRFSSDEDPTRECRAAWAVHREAGSASTAVIYFELEPGKRLGRHTDSAEEVLVVLEGTVEAVVGEERVRLEPGGMAVVPALVPHDVVNAGDRPARVAGMFSSNTIVAVFDGPWQPIGSNVVTTPPPAVSAAGATT
jgi:quercetin dioxygenase-like cupin family protein